MPSIPEKLRSLADGISALAEEAADEGNTALALDLFRIGATLKRTAEGLPALTKSTVTGRLRGDMEAAHRQKLSDARMDDVPPMLKLAREHGRGKVRTVADLAVALGYTKSGMSRVLSGDRGISEDAATKFAALTGHSWRAPKKG